MQKHYIRMRRLRIGILGTRGIPNQYGDFEQFAQYLSLGLVQRGHDVYVYNSENHPYKENAWNDVQIIHCKYPESRFGAFFGQFIYDLNCINDSRKQAFDIILHLGCTSDSIWHRRWPANTINIVNRGGMEWQRSKYYPARKFLKWVESLAVKHAQVLIADSPYTQHCIETTYGKRAAYIPYGAEVFSDTDLSVFRKNKLIPNEYFLLMARSEHENSIEMIIQGYISSQHPFPLVIIGDMANPFGRYLISEYTNSSIRFYGPVYDQPELNNIRFYSAKYFHGHSTGGTNLFLLEAMGCSCDIVAHNNVFNKAILQTDADYFSSPEDIAGIINKPAIEAIIHHRRQSNIEKINTIYNQEKNINDYEQLMFIAASKNIRLNKQITLYPPLHRTAEKPW